MRQAWRVAVVAALMIGGGPAVAQQGSAGAAIDQLGGFGTLPESSVCETVTDTTTERQVIRLHTQLLLTSLACGPAYGVDDTTLFNVYRQFTVDHADEIIRAQTAIEAQYGAGPAAESRFDEFRTAQANDEAGMINTMGPGAYCAMREARFLSLTGPDAVSFEGYADALAQRARSAAPRC